MCVYFFFYALLFRFSNAHASHSICFTGGRAAAARVASSSMWPRSRGVSSARASLVPLGSLSPAILVLWAEGAAMFTYRRCSHAQHSTSLSVLHRFNTKHKSSSFLFHLCRFSISVNAPLLPQRAGQTKEGIVVILSVVKLY